MSRIFSGKSYTFLAISPNFGKTVQPKMDTIQFRKISLRENNTAATCIFGNSKVKNWKKIHALSIQKPFTVIHLTRFFGKETRPLYVILNSLKRIKVKAYCQKTKVVLCIKGLWRGTTNKIVYHLRWGMEMKNKLDFFYQTVIIPFSLFNCWAHFGLKQQDNLCCGQWVV